MLPISKKSGSCALFCFRCHLCCNKKSDYQMTPDFSFRNRSVSIASLFEELNYCRNHFYFCIFHSRATVHVQVHVIHFSWLGPELSSVAWSTGAQMIFFFCFRFSVALFDRPGISIRHATHCICRVLVFDSS